MHQVNKKLDEVLLLIKVKFRVTHRLEAKDVIMGELFKCSCTRNPLL